MRDRDGAVRALLRECFELLWVRLEIAAENIPELS